MATKKKSPPPPAISHQRLLLSDAEIGKELFLEVVITPAGESGAQVRNQLWLLVAPTLPVSSFVNLAVDRPEDALLPFAYYLASIREYEAAGRLYRKFFKQVVPKRLGDSKRRLALLDANAARATRRLDRVKAWYEVGRGIREQERGWPMTNGRLAKKISAVTGDPPDTIRCELPHIELDAKTWKAKRKAQNERREFGSRNPTMTVKPSTRTSAQKNKSRIK